MKITKMRPIILKFDSKKTPGLVAKIILHDLNDALVMLQGRPELLREVRMEVIEALAKIEMMQANEWKKMKYGLDK